MNRSRLPSLPNAERRAQLFALVGLLLLLTAAMSAVAARPGPHLTVDGDRPARNTLIALQGYGHEGRVIEVNPAGEVVWEYSKGDDFFDVEALGEDRIQLAVADELPDAECPAAYRNDGYRNCVRNSLRIVNRDTQETVWEYAWYDAKLHAHELHDADHYRVRGKDRWVLVDMGNDRVFAVNREEEILWQWNASDTYERPSNMDPEGDWTHANDVDRLREGVFQVSLRNFDTVVELHVGENGSVRVKPVLGPNRFDGPHDPVHEQHNPDRLADGHLLIADSENDRVVEIDRSGEVVWTVGGSALLDWPRDADRLPNGHTLIADSYNDRVVEVNRRGEIVWAVETGALPYEVERLGNGEGSSDRPTASGTALKPRVEEASPLVSGAAYWASMAKYVMPNPLAEQIFLLSGALVAFALSGVERYRGRR